MREGVHHHEEGASSVASGTVSSDVPLSRIAPQPPLAHAYDDDARSVAKSDAAPSAPLPLPAAAPFGEAAPAASPVAAPPLAAPPLASRGCCSRLASCLYSGSSGP